MSPLVLRMMRRPNWTAPMSNRSCMVGNPQQRAGEDRHVAGRGLVALVGQAVGVGEAAADHAEALGMGVHQLREALDRAADILGDGRGDVVGRLDHHDLEGVVERISVPGLKPILDGGRAAAPSETVRSVSMLNWPRRTLSSAT